MLEFAEQISGAKFSVFTGDVVEGLFDLVGCKYNTEAETYAEGPCGL